MANTTKDNILKIAPELTDVVRNKRQIATLTVNQAIDSRNYIVSIDQVDYTVNSGTSATVASIAALLKTEIDTAALDVTVVDNLDGSLTISINDANNRFDIDTDKDVYMTAVITQKQYLGESLFDLVLEDVALEVTEEWFKTEQERGQRYLAAHILTVLSDNMSGTTPTGTTSGSGDVTREIVGDVEVWYSEEKSSSADGLTSIIDLKQTKYGRTYLGIRSRHSVTFV